LATILLLLALAAFHSLSLHVDVGFFFFAPFQTEASPTFPRFLLAAGVLLKLFLPPFQFALVNFYQQLPLRAFGLYFSLYYSFFVLSVVPALLSLLALASLPALKFITALFALSGLAFIYLDREEGGVRVFLAYSSFTSLSFVASVALSLN